MGVRDLAAVNVRAYSPSLLGGRLGDDCVLWIISVAVERGVDGLK